MSAKRSKSDDLLLGWLFSKAILAMWVGLFVVGGLLFFRIPQGVYSPILEHLNHFLQTRLGTNGKMKTIDLALHQLGVLCMAAGFAAPVWTAFWKYLINRAADRPRAHQESKAATILTAKEKVGLAFLTLGAAALRLPMIRQSLWSDEIVVYEKFIKPGLWHSIAPNEPIGNQPLMQLFVGIFVKTFGVSDLSLGLPILAVSLISIPLFFIWMKKMTGSSVAAWCVSFFTAIHSYHAYYSFQFRGYALVIFFVAMSMYAVYEIWTRPTRHSWILLAIANTCLMYNHVYNALFVMAQHLIVIALAWKEGSKPSLRQYLRAFLISGLITLVLIIPQLKNIMLLTFDPTVPSPPLLDHIRAVFSTAHYMISYSPWRTACVALAAAVGAGAAWLLARNTLALLLGGTMVILFAMTSLLPMRVGYYPRYLIAELPLFLMLFALVINALVRRSGSAGKAVAVGLIAIFFVLSANGYALTYTVVEDYRGASEFMRTQSADRIPQMAFSLGRDQFQYYNKAIMPIVDAQAFEEALRTHPEFLIAKAHYPNHTADHAIVELVEKNCRPLRKFPGEFPITVWHCPK